MSGHVIQRLILKIDKNVKSVEIDHNGACLCDCEGSEHQKEPSFTLILQWNSQKFKHYFRRQKWSFVQFVLKSLLHMQQLVLVKLGRPLNKIFFNAINNGNQLLPLLSNFYFVCSSCVVCCSSQICSSARHKSANHKSCVVRCSSQICSSARCFRSCRFDRRSPF